MKIRVISIILCVLFALGVLSSSTVFAENGESITILYENDVHCAIEGYSKLKALKDELLKTNTYVGVVSSGDYVQGSSLGAVSQGDYMVGAMNLVGYDALALGNHEFDFKLDRLGELCDELNTKPVCCNFKSIADNKTVFDPYTIVSYGDVDVAYIGVTTPETINSSSPAQFKDADGNYIYTFSGDNLYETVQDSIDSAKAQGADYIIGLTHLGTEYVYSQWSAQAVIENTEGFDVLLDGHSHSVVEGLEVEDKSGNMVLVSSTGTKFQYIGKLTIEDGNFSTELVNVESLTETDAEIDEYIETVNAEYAELGNRKVGESLVHLVDYDENGNRLIRTTQTNLGDFCADAFRVVLDADVGLMNGGGIRDDINVGDVTFNDILSVYPFNNTVCVVEVTGQQLVDLLEHCVRFYPVEAGAYQQVSGITFTLNAYIDTPVVVDSDNNFIKVEGERRVTDVKVLDKETGKMKPLELAEKYTVASHSYLLLDHGEGTTMLEGSTVLSNPGSLDVDLLEQYIKDYLGGVIGDEYKQSQGRVTVVNEAPAMPTEPDSVPKTEAETTVPAPGTDPTGFDETYPAEKSDAPNTGAVAFGASFTVFATVLIACTLVVKMRKIKKN